MSSTRRGFGKARSASSGRVEDAGEVRVEYGSRLVGQVALVDVRGSRDNADHLGMLDVKVDGRSRDDGEALEEVLG